MSISSSNSRNDYAGNGAVDTYNYTFRIFDEADLRVIVKDASDVETVLTIATDYTVTGVGASAGGTVVLVNNSQAWLDVDGDLLSTYSITIRRVLSLVQETDIRNQGAFLPEIHEDQFDKGIMIAQQQQDEIDRSARMPETVPASVFDPTFPASLPSNPGATVVVNSTGDGFELGPTGSQISSANADALAAAASATDAGQHATTASRWAKETASTVVDADTSVDSGEYSAKEYAIGTQRRGLASGGSSKDWANYTGGTVDNSEYSAKKYAQDAATSAAQAAVNASASLWTDVQYLTSASSPFTVTDLMVGTLFEVDCTSGAVVINLPTIAGLTLSGPWSIGIKKTDSSTNAITVNRGGTDTIDGATSKTINKQFAGATLIPDIDQAPDKWTSITFGEVPISGAIVGTTDTQTLTNKTLDNSNVIVARDDRFTIQDSADSTKQAVFEASGITPATTRTLTIPNDSGTIQLQKNATVQIFTSGSGTYTTPAGCLYLKVRMVGAGGGGGGSGTADGSAAGAGGDTTFGTRTAGGGGAGARLSPSGSGGTIGGSGYTIVESVQGNLGAYGNINPTTSGGTQLSGGVGGGTPYGSGGPGGIGGGGKEGVAWGAGGGGGGNDNINSSRSGSGGCSGGYVHLLITAPSSTYSYAVGAAGAAGGAGTSGRVGGTGASGYISVEEFY